MVLLDFCTQFGMRVPNLVAGELRLLHFAFVPDGPISFPFIVERVEHLSLLDGGLVVIADRVEAYWVRNDVTSQPGNWLPQLYLADLPAVRFIKEVYRSVRGPTSIGAALERTGAMIYKGVRWRVGGGCRQHDDESQTREESASLKHGNPPVC